MRPGVPAERGVAQIKGLGKAMPTLWMETKRHASPEFETRIASREAWVELTDLPAAPSHVDINVQLAGQA